MTISGPSQFELLTHLNRLRKDSVGYLVWANQTYGDFVHFKAGTVDAFFLNHPDAVRTVLRDHHNHYNKDTFQYNSLARITGKGLLTNSGPLWLQQRRIIQPAFSRQRLENIKPYALQASQAAVDRWLALPETERVIDVDREMMVLSLEVLGLALFGSDLSEQLNRLVDAVLIALDHIMMGARNLVSLPTSIPTRSNRRFLEALRTLDAAVKAMLDRRKELGLGDDLLSLLIRAQEEMGKQAVSDKQIRDEVITLLIAGHETVATALTWSWYLLAKHPQERDNLLAWADRLSDDDLEQETYPLFVFQESLRLYPPAWLITRKAIEADQVEGIDFHKNSLVILSPYTMHRNPQFWEDAEKFDPLRFEESRIKMQHKFAYIPFGGGPALCIGRNFALIEAQIVITKLSQFFRFDLTSQEAVKMDALVTLRPKGGLHMRLTERKHS